MNQPLVPRHADGAPAAAYDPSVDPAGLGVRTVGSDAASGELLDVLRVTGDLGRAADVAAGLRHRAARFAPASLEGLSPIARIDIAADGRLEVWSRRTEGYRLSAALEWADASGVATPLDAALAVGDRLLAALSSLQQADEGAGASGHGAIAVDQVVVSDSGALTLTDYAFSGVLADLQWPRERLWRRFRIAMPPAAGLARFDHRVDVTQAALVVCALLSGRLLGADEYPRDIVRIVSDAVRRAGGEAAPEDRDRLLAWLRAATEIENRSAFRSAAAAREALGASLGHLIGGDDAVREWLRAVRGLPPSAAPRAVAASAAPTPEAQPAPVAPVSIVPEPASRPAPIRPRRWFAWW